MEEYRVTQTGDEIQEIFNQSPVDTSDISELKEAATSLDGRLEAVEGKIPSGASEENPLADKQYVDDSIASASATFRGTYNEVTDLELTTEATHAEIGEALASVIDTADSNDYCFVQIPTADATPTEIESIERYKFVTGTGWQYEYTLNNSGFTADQWAAINSGITSGFVAKLADLPTNAELENLLNGKANAADVYTKSETYNKTELDAQLGEKANSADVYAKTDTYTKQEVDALITTPEVQYVTVTATSGTTSVTDVLPATGAANTIYRVGSWDGTQYDDGVYSEYSWNGSAYILLDVKNYGLATGSDFNNPTSAQRSLVTTVGSVLDGMPEGVFDVSARNSGSTWASLSALLSDADLDTLIPASWRKGGMTIRFVQTSDNNYVQFRYMKSDASTDATFTNVANWQGVDDVPIKSSHNLVESGGVYPYAEAVDSVFDNIPKEVSNGTNYDVASDSTINGRGGVLTNGTGKTISKLIVRVGSRSATTPITKVYLALRKDSYRGDVLYQGYVDFLYTDSGFYDITFELSSPVSYDGLIYFQIWSDVNIVKWRIIDGSYYGWPASNTNNPQLCYSTDNGANWSLQSRTATTINVPYIRYFDGSTAKVLGDSVIDTDNIKNGAVTSEKLGNDVVTAINSKAGEQEVASISQEVETLTDEVDNISPKVDEILENYDRLPHWTENGSQSEVYRFTFSGRGNSIAYNKTIYGLIVQIRNYSTTTLITKLKLTLLKDNKSGEVLATKIVDFDYTDTTLHEVEFDLSDNPVFYSGEIYCTIQANASSMGIRLISASDYQFIAKETYTTSTDLETEAVWIDASGSTHRYFYVKIKDGYEYKLAVGTEELVDESVTEEKLSEEVQEKINTPNVHAGVRAVLPSEFIVTTGSTLQVFYRGVVSAVNPYNYNIEVTVVNRQTGKTAGNAYPRYYSLKAVTEKIGVYDMTINVRANDNTIISTATSVIRVVANPSSPASQKNILLIGASVVSTGRIAEELRRRLTLTSGTLDTPTNPKGLGLQNVSFIGRKTGSIVTDINQEATGGWGWSSFTTAGVPRYRFYITDGSGDDIVIGDTCTMNGLTFTVKEKNITGGDGNISCTFTGTLVGEISATGTLELTSGDVNYSSYIYENANPFWNPNKAGDNKLDFDYYSDTYCNGASVNVLVSQLGVNSMAGATWDKEAILSQIKTFARAYKSYCTANSISGKFIISSIAVPDPNGGFGYNYGADGALSNYYTIVRRFFEFSEMIDELAQDQEFASFIIHAPVMQECDGENMYPYYQVNVNNRCTTKENLGANAYHPNGDRSNIANYLVGDNMIADAIYQSVCDVLS